MKNIKQKLYIAAAGIVVTASAYAYGVAYIDYNTGNYECNNGYKGYEASCNRNSNAFGTYKFCQKVVAQVCG